MSYNKFCAEDVLKALGTFPLEKKKVFIQDLKSILPYDIDVLEDTCVELARQGIINASTYTLKEGTRIRNIKLK